MEVESSQPKPNPTHNTESDPPLDDIEMVSEVNDEFSSPDLRTRPSGVRGFQKLYPMNIAWVSLR